MAGPGCHAGCRAGRTVRENSIRPVRTFQTLTVWSFEALARRSQAAFLARDPSAAALGSRGGDAHRCMGSHERAVTHLRWRAMGCPMGFPVEGSHSLWRWRRRRQRPRGGLRVDAPDDAVEVGGRKLLPVRGPGGAEDVVLVAAADVAWGRRQRVPEPHGRVAAAAGEAGPVGAERHVQNSLGVAWRWRQGRAGCRGGRRGARGGPGMESVQRVTGRTRNMDSGWYLMVRMCSVEIPCARRCGSAASGGRGGWPCRASPRSPGT